MSLLVPLVAAMVYALGALALRSATRSGAGPMRTTFLLNAALAVAFLSMVPWGDPPYWADPWWQPVVVGTVFFAGQVGTLLALEMGPSSIATPVLGTKVILVAVIVAFVVGEQLAWSTWAAAGLASAGIACLALTPAQVDLKGFAKTAAPALWAAATFACFDVMVRTWSPSAGFGRLVPAAMVVCLVQSFALFPLFRGPLVELVRDPPRGLWPGLVLVSVQSVAFVWSVGKFPDVAAANVAYGSRALWGVVFAWWLGPWFGVQEMDRSVRTLVGRLVGAAMIGGGIALVVAGGR